RGVDQRGRAVLLEDRVFERDHAALGVLLLLLYNFARDVDRVADEDRRDEAQFVDSIKRDDRFLIRRHLDYHSGRNAKDQRSMRNAAPEGTALGVLLTHVELDEISGESGEVHDVGFGDRPASRCGRFTDRVVFEIHEGYDNAPGEWSSRRGAKTRRAAEASCYNRKFMRKKVTVVGGGNVGASCALSLAFKELADVVLVDV